MKLLILDGCDNDPTVSDHLREFGQRQGAVVTVFPLSDLRLAPCLGDFECWLKTPGLCRTRDLAQDIAGAMHHADLVVFISPITFSGYSSTLKKAVDRLIGLVQPFFHDRDGLTRHMPRYERYAPILFVGLTDGKDEEAVETFHELALGNAINLIAPYFLTKIISPDTPGWQNILERNLMDMLSNKDFARPLARVAEDALEQACKGDPLDERLAYRVGSAVVLVGSARPKGTSTSESLAQELIVHLRESGTVISVIYANQFIKAGRTAEQALEAMLCADLLVISAPLYVDGLPYLVTSALEQLSCRMAQQTHALRRLVGILNCGYPEAIHNRIAMRMLRNFAHRNNLAWAGGLALGGGEIIQGRSMAAIRFVLPAPARALRLAALALSVGASIPPQAIRLMAKPLVSARLFRWMAKVRWVLEGFSNRISLKQLAACPWDQSASKTASMSSGIAQKN